MTRSRLKTERLVTSWIVLALNVALAIALGWLAVVYWQVVRPGIEAVPAWLRDGFPIALCIGILHFSRRSWRAWVRLKAR